MGLTLGNYKNHQQQQRQQKKKKKKKKIIIIIFKKTCNNNIEKPRISQGELIDLQSFDAVAHVGPIELFLVPASASQMVKQRLWYVLSSLWDGAYKGSLAANRKE